MSRSVREVLSLSEIRKQLVEANDAFDGPAGVAVFDVEGKIGVYIEVEDPVVVLPGDGKPFPRAAFVSAIAASAVRVFR